MYFIKVFTQPFDALPIRTYMGSGRKSHFYILRVYCAPNKNKQFMQSALKKFGLFWNAMSLVSLEWNESKNKILDNQVALNSFSAFK